MTVQKEGHTYNNRIAKSCADTMNIHKSMIFFIGFLLINFISYSQIQQCNLIKGSFLLTTLDIRSTNTYPVVMSGVSKTNLTDKLNETSKDSLIESFYQNAYFIPDIENGIERAVPYCLGDSLGYKYLKEHQITFAKLREAIMRCSSSTKFHLASGETVYCRTVMIEGSFWIMNKDNPAISTNSLEVPIKDVHSISNCYVPFEIEVMKSKSVRKK